MAAKGLHKSYGQQIFANAFFEKMERANFSILVVNGEKGCFSSWCTKVFLLLRVRWGKAF